MTPETFTYWLKGYFEISDSNCLSDNQVQIIRDHLDLVFAKVTPERNDSEPDFSHLLINNPFRKINTETKYC